MPDRVYDLLIIGQGAAGLSAAIYAARFRLDSVVVGDQLGGETALASTIENYPGVPNANGFDLMLQFRAQVDELGVPVLEERAIEVRRDDAGWLATLADGQKVRARALIFAQGRERRMLGLEHEREWTGRGISYCSACDAPLSRDRVVGVVGGGSAAVDGALLNAEYASQVYLLYRGAQLTRPEPALLDRLLAAPNVTVVLGAVVTELLGDASGLTGVRLDRSGAVTDLQLGALFIEIGADPRSELPASVGMLLNSGTGEVHVDRLMRTSVEGVFAAGDITDGSGPVKQTVTAAAQGAVAAISAHTYLRTSHRGAVHD